MSRYLLDTGALVGLTFLHDLWHEESERLFATDNTLYTSRTVLYEYCNSTRENSLETADVDWESEDGVFGGKLAKVRVAQMNLDLKYRSYDDEDLSIENLVDDFVSETGIDRDVFPAELIDERIKPNIRAFVVHELGDRQLTRALARQTMDTLCDTIQTEARKTRTRIRERTRMYPEETFDRDEYMPLLTFVDGYGDQRILSEVADLKNKNVLDTIVTADKSHMDGNRERLKSVLGIRVVYIKDEFAKHSIPSED